MAIHDGNPFWPTPGDFSVKSAANFLGFQLIWWLMVLFQNQYVWVALILFVCHFFMVKHPWIEGGTLLGVACAGIALDSLLTISGMFAFPQQSIMSGLIPIPIWLVALWISFAATLRHSLSYLARRPMIASILGGVGGPLSYLAGERFGAVVFGYSSGLTLILLAFLWALLMPLAFVYIHYLENRLSGVKNLQGNV